MKFLSNWARKHINLSAHFWSFYLSTELKSQIIAYKHHLQFPEVSSISIRVLMLAGSVNYITQSVQRHRGIDSYYYSPWRKYERLNEI